MGVRWWLPALALAAVVAIGAACDDDDEPTDPGVTDDEIVLGAHAPLSGPAGVTAAVQQGTRAYFDYLNASEGGIDGREVRYEIRDDQFQPAQARIAVQELIEQEQVFASSATPAPRGTSRPSR